MPDIDPRTGIDLDLPYDDPAMMAIRQQLAASGQATQGPRSLLPQDAQAIARADALRYQNVKPGAVAQRAAAMQQNPEMINNIDLEAVAPRLREMSPETFNRLMGVRNDQVGNTPSSVQADAPQMPPGPPEVAPPPDGDADDQTTMAAPQSQGSGLDSLLKFLFGTAAGAALMNMYSRTRGNGMQAPDREMAPGARQAVEGDFTVSAEPQQGGKASKTKVTKDTKGAPKQDAPKADGKKAKGREFVDKKGRPLPPNEQGAKGWPPGTSKWAENPGDDAGAKKMAEKFANPDAKKRVEDAKAQKKQPPKQQPAPKQQPKKPEPPKKKGSRLAKAVRGRIKR